MPVFGPGVLKIGDAAAAIDVSCLVNGARIAATKDQGDTTYKLCGTSRPGLIRYTREMTGNMDIDPEDPDGIFMLSQTEYGTSVAFVFTPNSTTAVTATGNLIIDPLDFGADEYGADMTSDFAWAIDGEVTYAPTPPVAADEAAAELAAGKSRQTADAS